MPAQKPQRPALGSSISLPRVKDQPTQRAFDKVGPALQQATAIAASAQTGLATLTSTVSALPGRLVLKPTALTSSGTHALNAATCVVRGFLLAAGGGGGGAGGGANAAAGAGGGSGNYLAFAIGTPGTPLADAGITSLTYSAPLSGGAGGANTGGTGATGGDATLTYGSTTLTAKGGTGGAGMASTTLGNSAGGAGAAGSSSGGDVLWSGSNRGTQGLVVGGGSFPGDGAGAPGGVGTGGAGPVGSFATGGAASGFGAGGGGANADGAGFAGGSGAPAVIVIQEET